jgi:parallel beta-helix repeat protein
MFCASHTWAATYTVTNTSDTGAGSLRRAVTNANGNAGTDIIAFSIPSGSLTSGVAIIRLTSGPLVITEAVTVDGTTQTSNVGNTNAGSLGVGGTVGVGALSLSAVNRPEVQVINNASPAIAIGFDLQASGVTIRGLSIYGFGTTANDDASGNIRIGIGFSNTRIEQNILGASATSFSDPGATRSVGDNIRSAGGDSGIIQNNLIGYSNGKGIQLGGGSNGWTVQNNEVRWNGINNSNLDGIDIENGSGGNTVSGNLFIANEALGVDMYQSSGTNTVQNNTITGNGIGNNANVETAGVRVYGTGNLIDRNIINANFGAGVLVTVNSTQNTITRNSIYSNGTITNKSGGAAATGEIGIDLESSTDNENTGTAPYVTINDSGDADTGGNGLLNFPVLVSATVNGTNLVLTGYARPNSVIELFIADNDPKKFGEGQTYLTTLTEGSVSDTDATTGTYTSPVNTLTVGTDTTNKFKFTIPLPGGVSAGTSLTATATLANSTSEFSGNVTVSNAPKITLAKCMYVGASCLQTSIPDVQPGTDLVYRIDFSNTSGTTAQGLTIIDVIPFAVVGTTTVRITEFKIGSMIFTPGTSGLTLSSFKYWNDAIGYPAPTPPWTPSLAYTPSGTYDPNVSYVGWALNGNMANGTSGSVTFTVRVK